MRESNEKTLLDKKPNSKRIKPFLVLTKKIKNLINSSRQIKKTCLVVWDASFLFYKDKYVVMQQQDKAEDSCVSFDNSVEKSTKSSFRSKKLPGIFFDSHFKKKLISKQFCINCQNNMLQLASMYSKIYLISLQR